MKFLPAASVLYTNSKHDVITKFNVLKCLVLCDSQAGGQQMWAYFFSSKGERFDTNA